MIYYKWLVKRGQDERVSETELQELAHQCRNWDELLRNIHTKYVFVPCCGLTLEDFLGLQYPNYPGK
jgi:hypothetical protein